MKNQNDLIVTIVALVVGLGVALGFYFTKRVPVKPADPQPVVVTPAKPQAGAVTFGTSLPGGTGGGGGGTSGGGSSSPAPGVPGGGSSPMKKKGPIGAAS